MLEFQDGGKLALSIPEFCAAVGIGRSRTYNEIKAGRLRILKCGRRTLISREAVTAWLSSLSAASAEPTSLAALSDV
jgi:excisionase family DNA binding protein